MLASKERQDLVDLKEREDHQERRVLLDLKVLKEKLELMEDRDDQDPLGLQAHQGIEVPQAYPALRGQ